jgi:hypothetical protein
MLVAKNWLARGIACESTSLPDRSFAETELTQYGLTEQFPYHTEFTALNCTFNTPLNGGDNPIQRVFHAWQNLIQDMTAGYNSSRDFTFAGSGGSSDPKGYYGEIYLAVFDRQNNPTIGYQFERAYPKLVDAVAVSWSTESEVTKLPVTFTFSAWSVWQVPKDFFPNTPPSGLDVFTPSETTGIPGGSSIVLPEEGPAQGVPSATPITAVREAPGPPPGEITSVAQQGDHVIASSTTSSRGTPGEMTLIPLTIAPTIRG